MFWSITKASPGRVSIGKAGTSCGSAPNGSTAVSFFCARNGLTASYKGDLCEPGITLRQPLSLSSESR